MLATIRPGVPSRGSAQSATAPAARSQPSRRPRRITSSVTRSSRLSSSSRNDPRRVCSVSSRASATATSVSAAIAATCRYSPASSLPGPSSSTAPTSWPPEEIATSAVTSEGRSGLPPASREPTYRSYRAHSAGTPDPRHDDRDRRPGVPRRDLRDALEPLAGHDGAHHLEVGAAWRRNRLRSGQLARQVTAR